MKFLLFICIAILGLYAKGDGVRGGLDVKPVDNELYKKECASCHFGYQPGLMPTQSWEFIMKNLADHYGTDASIDDETNKSILSYLLANSSQNAMNYKRSAKITKSLENRVLYQSITDIPYHIKKHKKIEKRMITQKEVKTLSNCTACHKKAELGIYGKKSIDIPNYGAWRD